MSEAPGSGVRNGALRKPGDISALERRSRRVRLARLEADMAYFQARLQLIDDHGSRYQQAQRQVFELLLAAFSAAADRLRAAH